MTATAATGCRIPLFLWNPPMLRPLAASMILAAGATLAGAAENLLRNGSFEGGLLYWHNIMPEHHQVVTGGKNGVHALRIDKKNVMSAPFVCQPGKPITASFWVKGDAKGEVRVQIPPSAREVGHNHGRLWTAKATKAVPIGTEWQRVTVSMPADVPQDGFWTRPHYLLQLEGTVAMTVDGMVVTQESAGAADYVPRRTVEVGVSCPDLKGYTVDGNLLERGQTVRVVAHLSNPGATAKTVAVRWQLIDYEGVEPRGAAVERNVTLAPGQTLHEAAPLTLETPGTVLARVSVSEGGTLIDRSDQPLTSLPYPFAPRKPDPRERFGGSFFGKHTATLGSRMGFAWSRWFPHTKWHDHQPDNRETFRWFDPELDLLEGLGISSHLVMYGWPKWIMDEEGKVKNPLPKDMRWKGDDPRWDDLSVVTAWDDYIVKAVGHYRGRSVVYEIENEPEFDRWDDFKDEYARFTIRTAKLIKRTDPTAKVMVNNVYGIPSGINRHLLERGAAKHIDIISWHDYHEGWLADAMAIKRMKANLAQFGGEHIEIWFNEGWSFTNTAVDEPIACTRLTSAQSTNATVDSIVELTVAGQAKCILFHTGYERHGMSFWDYSGPGTQLWDWYGNPLPLVPAWNVMNHHIGLSETLGQVRPAGANLCVFQDLRNGRGVMVAYADREATADATLELPFDGLIAEDAMGHTRPLDGRTLMLSQSGRPVFLYDAKRTAGRDFLAAIEPLDRRHASFIAAEGAVSLPAVWAGTANGSAAGNPATADGRPVWRLDQVFPPDPAVPGNYRPLTWNDGWWIAAKDGFGGQPKVEQKDRGIRMEFRASHNTSPGEKLSALVYIADRAGEHRLSGSAELRLWDGDNPTRLTLWHKTAGAARQVATTPLKPGERFDLSGWCATVAAGDELVLVPRIEGMFTGGDVTVRDLTVTTGGAPSWRLPAVWEGTKTGTAAGNPITAGGEPVWRLDHLWPAKEFIIAANYKPLVWSGTEWIADAHGHGGQPALRVADGSFQAAVRGVWGGVDGEQQRTGALVFIAPRTAVFRVRGSARCKPWEGDAKGYPLVVLKKDTQRAAEVKRLELPRDDMPVPFDLEVELTDGHELLFLPLMPHWHNAATVRLDGLEVSAK
jgi:hypothetical protein